MEVLQDRDITAFPIAPNSDTSPYQKFRFDHEVRDFCEREKSVEKLTLRVAKVVIVGDIAVGKTCLINRFGYNIFTNNYKATIGVDFDVQKFKILSLPFNLQIWDTAGQERFKCITSSYYRGAHVAVSVFDLSNMSTLLASRKWLEEVLESNPTSSPLLFLVGNKKDLLCDSACQFVDEEGRKLAKELNAEYWCVSAMSGDSVHDFFNRVAVLTFQEMVWREIETVNNEKERGKAPVKYSDSFVKLGKKPKKDFKNCFQVSSCMK